MRWVFLSFAVGLLALSLLTVLRAWNTTLWKAAIIAGEFGHYLGLVALVLACAIVAQAAVMGVSDGVSPRLQWWLVGGSLVASVAAMALFFLPAVFGAMVGKGLPQKLAGAFGHPAPGRQVLSFGEMLIPLPVIEPVATSAHVFAHAGTPEELKLDFYPPSSASIHGPVPCVIMVHGGGWDSGDRTQLATFNHWLARRGYAVAAISYRLAPAHPWPAQREDTLAAMSWLKAHAETLGIDPGRLVLMGRSAGAQIAAAVAYGEPDPAVRGVIGLYGVYDMNFVWSIAREDDVLNSVKLMQQYLGGAPTLANQAAYDSASAQGLVVAAQTPPTLLLHGTIDTLCWVKHSQRLAMRLQEAGVAHAMIELPWGVHAFDFNLHGPGGQLTAYAVEAFLQAVCSHPAGK